MTGVQPLQQRYLVTNQEADLRNKKPRRVWGGLKLVILFFGLFFCYGVFVGVAKRFECVEMPNGFLIGRATFFSEMIGWGPDIAIKYPDGRLFLRGDKTMNFWDEDSFAGELEDTPEGKPDWRGL